MELIMNELLLELTQRIIPSQSDEHSARRKRRYNSILDPYRYEILTLHNELDCSLGIIQKWLKMKHQIDISKTAIHNRIRRWETVTCRDQTNDNKQQEKE